MQRKARAGTSRWDRRSASRSSVGPPLSNLRGRFHNVESPAATATALPAEDVGICEAQEPSPPPRISRPQTAPNAQAATVSLPGPCPSAAAVSACDTWPSSGIDAAKERARASGRRWLIVVLASVCLNLAIVTAIAFFTFPPRSLPRTITLSAVISEPAVLEEKLELESPLETEPQATNDGPSLPAVSVDSLPQTSTTAIELTNTGTAIAALPPSGELPGAAGLSQLVQLRGGTEFCGSPATGRRFVFLVDSSRSMARGRLELAKQQLLLAIRRLQPDQKFQVIFYDQKLHFVTDTGSVSDLELLPATRENHLKLEEWMRTVGCQQGGSPEPALEFALDLAPDAIFLLSDGDFSDKVVQRARRLNRVEDSIFGDHCLVVIHTISFARSLKTGGERVRRMQTLARENSGTHRFFIARPDSVQRR